MTKIEIKIIKPNPYNIEDINEENVEQLRRDKYYKGVLGRKNGKYVELAYGHNRIEAAKRNGEKYIDIEIKNLSDEDMLTLLHKENFNRKEYSEKQLKKIVEKLYSSKKYTQEEIAEKLNVNICKIKQVIDIDDDLLELIDKGKRAKDDEDYKNITLTNAHSLSRIKNKVSRDKILETQRDSMMHARTFNRAVTVYLNADENTKRKIENGELSIVEGAVNIERQKNDDNFKHFDYKAKEDWVLKISDSIENTGKLLKEEMETLETCSNSKIQLLYRYVKVDIDSNYTPFLKLLMHRATNKEIKKLEEVEYND